MQEAGEPIDGKRGGGALSSRFDEALVLANNLHRRQVRKASGVPYMAHLLAVASLVLEEGGNEDMAIAALLHDAAEDQGGEATLAGIEAAFGVEVARWVRQASDTLELPKPAWEQRKKHHLEAIPKADREARLIMLADKVHNARSILADHARVGTEVWDRFSAPRERTVWYYQSLLDVFDRTLSAVLYDELVDCVKQMQELG
jgi:(p)ppGpp synthase/HD superfamily hydrolase